jgi:LDH2 family malate/lactate/ureidoglycolate dehydrogenase
LPQIRSSRKAPGTDRIYTAGEKEFEACSTRKAHGCPVPPSLRKMMDELRDQFKLEYRFDFE